MRSHRRTLSALTLATCALSMGLAHAQVVTLKFMYWGSPDEKTAITNMVRQFEASHPNIKIDAQHVPANYDTKMNTLVAAGQQPDVAYMTVNQAMLFGEQGKLLNFVPYYKKYADLADRLPASYLYTSPTNSVGTRTALEMMTLYYNKDIFKAANIALPPATAAKAWTWDQFVQTAQKLTVDRQGHTANQAGFDPKNIKQYGVLFPTWYLGLAPFLSSNGAELASQGGTKYALNSPQSVEVFQKLQDLIYKYHVAPTPAQAQSLPATALQLQARQTAMAIDGQWSLLNFADTKGNFGMGVLPKFKKPVTVAFAAITTIFKNTKHPEEAMEFYRFHNNPQYVNLFAKGLWMPLEKKYYTDAKSIAAWTGNPAHPAEFRTAVVDYTLKNAMPNMFDYYKNMQRIDSVLSAGLDGIWQGKQTAKQALDALAPQIQPLLQGQYPQLTPSK